MVGARATASALHWFRMIHAADLKRSARHRMAIGTVESGFEASVGGARGIRTPDPLHAMQVLSQLSYGPTRGAREMVAGAARAGASDCGECDAFANGQGRHYCLSLYECQRIAARGVARSRSAR